MTLIRLYYQRKVRLEGHKATITGAKWHSIPGALAAITSILFGLAYTFFPDTCSWAYLELPSWFRWLGAFMLLGGITLLAYAHHHFGKSFH